jgi:hypothetical protein
MLAEAPQFLVALEQSALGTAIRESTWAYPIANVGHILALTLFVSSVAIMDLRILGAFAGTTPARVIYPARWVAMLGFTLMAITGLTLFTAEASHVSMNRVFQLKAALISLGLTNAFVIAGPALAKVADLPPNAALPSRARVAAIISLMIWITVAACGRLIAYF